MSRSLEPLTSQGYCDEEAHHHAMAEWELYDHFNTGMKYPMFVQYMDKVAEACGMTKERLLEKTKEREVVDARQMLYYLCHHQPMSIASIHRFMKSSGHTTVYTTIRHGVMEFEKRLKEDKDCKKILNQIRKSVGLPQKSNLSNEHI